MNRAGGGDQSKRVMRMDPLNEAGLTQIEVGAGCALEALANDRGTVAAVANYVSMNLQATRGGESTRTECTARGERARRRNFESKKGARILRPLNSLGELFSRSNLTSSVSMAVRKREDVTHGDEVLFIISVTDTNDSRQPNIHLSQFLRQRSEGNIERDRDATNVGSHHSLDSKHGVVARSRCEANDYATATGVRWRRTGKGCSGGGMTNARSPVGAAPHRN